MNRRTAKKHRKGMYKELGFSLDGKFKPGLTEEQTSQVWESLCNKVDSLGITFGGGWSPETFNFGFCSVKKYTCTTFEQFEEIRRWAEGRVEFLSFEMKDKIDMWEGQPDE